MFPKPQSIHTLRAVFKLGYFFAIHILLTAFFILLTSIISFTLGIAMNIFILPISFLIATIIILISAKKYIKAKKSSIFTVLLSMIVLFAIYIGAMIFSQQFYDLSFDGQTYHQETILTIVKKQWNPVRDSNPNVNDIDSIIGKIDTWVKHYAKGSEIISSSVYSVTGKIESGKVFNILLIISSFLLSTYVLDDIFKIKPLFNILISIILALNPVSVYQSLTYYLDGEISSLIIIGALLIPLIIKKHKTLDVLGFIAIIVLLTNFKFTAILFAIIICTTLLIFQYIKTRNIKDFIKLALILFFSGIVSLLFIGFNPYVYNTLEYKHPFYPLRGENHINFMPENTPDEYKNINRLKRVITSNMGINFTEKDFFKQKKPLLPNNSDLLLFEFADTRKYGFGIYFMEICITSAILYIYIILSKNIEKNKKFILCGVSTILAISGILVPDFWWSRYVPQLFLIPILPLILLFSIKRHSFLTNLLLFFLLVNSFYTVYAHLYFTSKDTKITNDTIKVLKKYNDNIYIQRKIRLPNNYVKLEENGIKYNWVYEDVEWNSLKQIDGTFFPRSDIEFRHKVEKEQ